MSSPPPDAAPGMKVLAGPQRVGSESRWTVELADGSQALLGQLLPELATDESIRRRYVRDVERLRDLDVDGLATTRAFGPMPDPRAIDAAPPWRLREDPPGETLEAWLRRRAPAPIDEVASLVANLAEVVHQIHARGAVLRDLHPRWIVLSDDGRVFLTDVGLARVDILSTRTAASLILEGSPYASPEQLRSTTLDQRSDLFGLGVILYQALTGALPFGDGPALLRETSELLAANRLRPELSSSISELISACLSDDPESRPESATDVVAVLRGQAGSTTRALALATCQSCGAPLRPGQRICLACGKQAIVFRHSQADPSVLKEVLLTKATEDTEFLTRLRDFLDSVSETPTPTLNFVIGDQRMYSKAELARRIKLPICLFTDLDAQTAEDLRERLSQRGFAVKVRDKIRTGIGPRQRKGFVIGAAAMVVVTAGVAIVAPAFAAIGVGAVGGVALLTTFLIMRSKGKKPPGPGLLRLRTGPAALPASDPLVARLSSLLSPTTPADVRDQLGELALLVQRTVDHRAKLHASGSEVGLEADMLTEPLSPIVALVEDQVRTLRDLDDELSRLDEGTIVRALVASEARAEPRSARAELLAGLDRLRSLEERRALSMHALLEASTLLRRAADLGLSVQDPVAEHERNVQLALHALGPASG